MKTKEHNRNLKPSALVVLDRGRYVKPVESGRENFFDVKDESRGILLEKVGGDSYPSLGCWMVLLNGERLLAWEDQLKTI